MKTSLMALRAGRPEHTPEAEPVLVDTDTPGVVRLVLDDGDVVELDATELLLAVASTQRQAA
jgi:hypothetical protein